jgi:hypothetical protein
VAQPTARSAEADAFIEARQHVPPGVVSACTGWTAHEVTAHLTGIAVEISRHLVPHLAGTPVPKTRSFEERESPLQAMHDDELCQRLESEEQRARLLLDQALAQDPDAAIEWTGRQMALEKFWPHLRNEFAIHRWDLIGDDDVGAELLGQSDLTEHSVGFWARSSLDAAGSMTPLPTMTFTCVCVRARHQMSASWQKGAPPFSSWRIQRTTSPVSTSMLQRGSW